jgi:ribonucleoside-diphosphate reductase alpha chain
MSTMNQGEHGLGLQELQALTVRKRDGRVASFDAGRIYRAMEKAFKADAGIALDRPLSEQMEAVVLGLTHSVGEQCRQRVARGEDVDVEHIQDLVENTLMAAGHHSVARRYILYREERRKARALRGETDAAGRPVAQLYVTRPDGVREPLDAERIRRRIDRACEGLQEHCSSATLAGVTLQSLYDGVHTREIDQALVMSVKARIEREPEYTYVAARLLLDRLYREAVAANPADEQFDARYRAGFGAYVNLGIRVGRLSPDLAGFDLARLGSAMRIECDRAFTYMGLQTLYDRYLLHHEGRRIETPQYFWMRVAMGLALNEGARKNERAIEFYNVLSSFRFVSSTPTLFNAGTKHPQLSSCYLSTTMDDLDHIFKVVADDAKLSKWAGGLGNDWTNVRATGSRIKGTNGTSQGVIPFLKVANDTAVAVNQGGKRKGAMCAYLETWHLDIEDFLELRRNTGDERRRTHDMNPANWIPDLFMKRVMEKKPWTLFSPSDTPDLHDLYGAAFEQRYLAYEAMADRGELKLFKRIDAEGLWRKMLTMLFETGHPWITFKDPSNIRSPQDHAGVVHSSNLCTEILLNTSAEETAVCNLGSVNLVAHLADGKLDEARIASTVRTAMRMLDNVIDINFYPTPEARTANLRHRPVGLGLMAFQDALYSLRIPYSSDAAVAFADRSMEMVSYYAILASTELAAERGPYSTFKGSKWDRGLLPIDTLQLLEDARGLKVEVDRSTTMDWSAVRAAVKAHGMRNSNTMAIAPTATISNISGVIQSIEPTYKNLYAKSNLSGEFTTPNVYLIQELRKLHLWDEEMLDDLKYFDGSIQEIDRIPAEVKNIYRTAFEIEPSWLIACAARRQKWIDMGQSLNLYLGEPNGRKLSDMYMLAWRCGLKTTYYLRTVAATSIEKSTTDINKRGLQPRWMKNRSASSNVVVDRAAAPKACSIDNPDCESCQ